MNNEPKISRLTAIDELNKSMTASDIVQARISALNRLRKRLGVFAKQQKQVIDMRLSEIEKLHREMQNNNIIEWRVLDIDEAGKRALVITKDCVAQMPYHEPGGGTSWAHCTLRNFFLDELFGRLPALIQSRVLSVSLPYPDKFDKVVETTVDRLFLLSVDEAKRYFPDAKSRIARFEESPLWSWWLRSPGIVSNAAALVASDGYVNFDGKGVNWNCGVRPALWLNLD